jgi:adenosylhomocysteine nucleosidase
MVQGAVDGEIQPLLAALSGKAEVRIHAWTYWTGTIAGRKVVVARTGVGPINAVASTTLGVERFKPNAIINQGTAGAHNPELKLWDIVVGERTLDYSGWKSEHGDEGTGIRPDRWRPHAFTLHEPGGNVAQYNWFSGDRALIEAAMRLKNPRGRVKRGVIGSAFQFNREIDMLKALRGVFGTDTEDMESAYAAGAALALSTPLVAIRMISDSEFHHPTFERIAGKYCAEFVLQLVRQLPPR